MTGKGETQGGKRIGRFALQIDKRVESILLKEKIQKVIGYSHIDRVTAQKNENGSKKVITGN